MKFRTVTNSLYVIDEENMMFSRLSEIPVMNNPDETYQRIAIFKIPQVKIGERVHILFADGDNLNTSPVKEIL